MTDWTQDARFNHFWKNYNHGQNWYIKHQISYWRSKAVAADYENSFLQWLLRSPLEFEQQYSSAPSKHTENFATFAQQTEEDSNYQQTDSNHEIEMEITGDMLEFIAHSMKHKKEREERDTKEEVTYINVDEIPIERVSSDFQDHIHTYSPNSYGDNQNYIQLYGANASRIQAMETAIQLNFNRNCDRKQPKLWPNMPLHL